MLRATRTALVALSLLSLSGRAQAQMPPGFDAGVTIRRIVDENLRRLRRAVALGPHAGGVALYAPSPGEFDGGLSVGLGLYIFRVPTTFEVQDTVVQSAKQRLEERVKALTSQGASPSADDLEALARKIFDDVRAEVTGQRPLPPRVVERPLFGLVFEGTKLLRADEWQLRLTPSVGITSFLSIGPTLGTQFRGGPTLLLGGELSVRLLPQPGPRSPVVDLFLRAEFAGARRSEFDDQVGLGVRLLLDVL